jgi:predicted ATP-binding protein involved in virulence
VAANELRLNMLDLLLVKYYKKKRIWLQVEWVTSW